MVMKTERSGHKIMKISMSHMSINTNAGSLLKLAAFAQMDASVLPMDPVGLEGVALLQYKADPGKGMEIEISITQVLFCMGAKC